jgi:hypothetical protein
MAVACVSVVGLFGAGPLAAKAKHHKAPHAQILVTVSPNPAVETSTSNVDLVIQVETNPTFANDTVTISSTQLTAACPGAANNPAYATLEGGTPLAPVAPLNSITVTLDNDGNATVTVDALNCRPGTDLVEADLNAPPFLTATTRLTLLPPQVTPRGIKGYPANEVVTGDGGQGLYSASDLYSVFYVETNPVFAEQTVTIAADQLTERCGLGFSWYNSASFPATVVAGANGSLGPGSTGNVVSQALDNDGNAAFIFTGASCAAGKSTIVAEVLNNGPTYSTQYNILPPAVTI